MNPLSYSNQSAQPQQAGSSAALTSAQLSQAVSSAAAISQLVCSGAAFHIGRSVSAELQCVSSSAYAVNLLAGKKNASTGSDCQPASGNVAQPFL